MLAKDAVVKILTELQKLPAMECIPGAPIPDAKKHHKFIRNLILNMSLLGKQEFSDEDVNNAKLSFKKKLQDFLNKPIDKLSIDTIHEYLHIISCAIMRGKADRTSPYKVRKYLSKQTYIINENDEILWTEFFNNAKLGLELLMGVSGYDSAKTPSTKLPFLDQQAFERIYELRDKIIEIVYKEVIPQYKIQKLSEAILKYASSLGKKCKDVCESEIKHLNSNCEYEILLNKFTGFTSEPSAVVPHALIIYKFKVKYQNEEKYFRNLSNHFLYIYNEDEIHKYRVAFYKIFADFPSEALIIALCIGNFNEATVISRYGKYTNAGRRKLFLYGDYKFPNKKGYSVKINHLSEAAIYAISIHVIGGMERCKIGSESSLIKFQEKFDLLRNSLELQKFKLNKSKNPQQDETKLKGYASIIIKIQRRIINYLAKNQIVSALLHLASLGNYIRINRDLLVPVRIRDFSIALCEADQEHIAKWLAVITKTIKEIDQNDEPELLVFSKAIKFGLSAINKKFTALFDKGVSQAQVNHDELANEIKGLALELTPLHNFYITRYCFKALFWNNEKQQHEEANNFVEDCIVRVWVQKSNKIKQLKKSIEENLEKFAHRDDKSAFINILGKLELVERVGYHILSMLRNSSYDPVKKKAGFILDSLNEAIKNIKSTTIKMALRILYLKIVYQHCEESYREELKKYIKTNKDLLNENSQPDYYSGLRFNLYKILDKEDAAMLAGVTGNKNEKLTIEKYKYFSKNNRARLFASNLPGPIKKLSTLATCCLPGWVKCRGRGRGSCW